jgi:hypothetical protein
VRLYERLATQDKVLYTETFSTIIGPAKFTDGLNRETPGWVASTP